MIKKVLLSLVVLLSFVSAVNAADYKFNGYVADMANVLQDESEKVLNLTLHDLHKKTKSDLAVVVVESLKGESIDKATLNVLEDYKIGDPEKKNGVVFYISINDHQLQVLLDDGLNGKVTPDQMKSIIDKNVIPFFEKNEFDKGIIRGSYLLADAVGAVEKQEVQHFGEMPELESGIKDFNKNWLWLLVIPVLGFIGGIIWSLVASARKNQD